MLQPKVDSKENKKRGACRAAMGCVAENTPGFLEQALCLLRSVRWFGGAMADVDFFVCVVGDVDAEYARAYEQLGAFVRITSPVSDHRRHSNKLRLLDLPEIKAYDMVILLDCDTLIVQDPSPFLDGDVFQAKIADLPTIPNHVFRDLFRRIGLPLPAQNYHCTLNKAPTIWYCNTGVLVFPKHILSTLGSTWRRMNTSLLERLDFLFGDYAWFYDQASLSLAFAERPVPFRELPISMNFPLHLTPWMELSAMPAFDPVIIHHHHRIDPDGYIQACPHPAVRKRIDTFNERLRRHRRERPPAECGRIRAHVKETQGVRSGSNRADTIRPVHQEELRHDAIDSLPAPVFIIGCMRSGTTLLAQMLNRVDEVVYCPFELKQIWSEVGGVPMASPKTRDTICPQLGPEDVTPGQADRLARAFMTEIRKNRSHMGENAVFLTKNPHLCNKLPFVDALFPDARFIWIHRGLSMVVASLKKLFEEACRRRQIRHYWPEPRPDVTTRCWEAFHFTGPPNSVDSARCFPGGDVKFLAEYWLESNHAITVFFQTIPAHRYLRITEERLVADPEIELTRCLEFLDLSPNAAIKGLDIELDNSRNQLFKSRLTWKEKEAVGEFLAMHARTIHEISEDGNRTLHRQKPLVPPRKPMDELLVNTRDVYPCHSLDVRLLNKTVRTAAVLVNMKNGPSMLLNETGRTIWRLCDGAHALEDILNELKRRFPEVEEDILARDMNDFIDNMVIRGFLRLSPAHRDHLKNISKTQSVPHDLSSIRTVCLILGPYRNLTTLTAGILALHPSCQVLNHGAIRILPQEGLDFLQDYCEPKFERFLRYALSVSQEWQAGFYGGSIITSHAFFNHSVLERTFRERYGLSLLKDHIRCLLWKDSMLLSNHIKQNNPDLAGIFNQNEKLRFMMPIRNPMDSAISNYRYGMNRYLELKEFSLENILDRILKEIAWFLDLQATYPDRFFHYFENEFDENLLLRLAEFTRLEPDNHWLRDSLHCYRLKQPYAYTTEFITLFDRLIDRYFSKHPSVLKKMAAFSHRAARLDANSPLLPRMDVMHRDELDGITAVLVKTGPARLLDADEQSVWRLCDGVRTRNEILQELMDRKGGCEIIGKRDLDEFINDLIFQGFLAFPSDTGVHE